MTSVADMEIFLEVYFSAYLTHAQECLLVSSGKATEIPTGNVMVTRLREFY